MDARRLAVLRDEILAVSARIGPIATSISAAIRHRRWSRSTGIYAS
jgi:hypothetical protein